MRLLYPSICFDVLESILHYQEKSITTSSATGEINALLSRVFPHQTDIFIPFLYANGQIKVLAVAMILTNQKENMVNSVVLTSIPAPRIVKEYKS